MILPLRNTKPSANRPPTHSIESFFRTHAWRYTTTLSPFTKNFSGSQVPSAHVPRPFVTCSCTSAIPPIGAGCSKALGLNAHNVRIKILSDGLHIIAIDCSEECFECFGFGGHGFISRRPGRDSSLTLNQIIARVAGRRPSAGPAAARPAQPAPPSPSFQINVQAHDRPGLVVSYRSLGNAHAGEPGLVRQTADIGFGMGVAQAG